MHTFPSYFRFLLIYIVINAYIFFKCEKPGNISLHLQYDNHVTPPANLLKSVTSIICISIYPLYLRLISV